MKVLNNTAIDAMIFSGCHD